MSLVNKNYDPVDITLNKYVDHLSIMKIKQYFNEPTEFNFSEVTPNGIEKETKKLDSSEDPTFKNITPKSVKEVANVCSPLCDIWTGEIVRRGTFPKDLKNADVTSFF